MRKKICILTPFYPPNIGGAETFTEMLVIEASKKHDVQVLTFMPLRGEGNEVEVKKYGTNYVGINRVHWLWKPPKVWQGVGIMNFLLVFPKLFKVAKFYQRTVNFDIIHAQGLLSTLIAVLVKRKNAHIKVYSTMLALYDFRNKPRWFKAIARWIFKRCDTVFVEGETGIYDIMDTGHKQYEITGYDVIPFEHWVDERFKPMSQGIQSLTPTILFVGRDIKIKGKHIIQEVEERFKAEGIKAKFRYVHDMPYEWLHGAYQDADILVVPSLYSEGFVRVIAEAASCGCAIVSSNCGSLGEMVKGFGVYVEPTVEAFSHELENLVKHPSVLRIVQGTALEYAQKHFTNKNADTFLREYEA